MHHHRWCPAKCLVEHEMLGDRRDPFLSANHMGNPHQVIVHHGRKMVGRIPI